MNTQTGSTQETPLRRKEHKTGKIFSLTVIWSGVAVVVLLVAVQLSTMFTSTEIKRHNRDLTAATSMTKILQPMSTKIVAADSETVISMGDEEAEDYTEVWKMLYRLAPDTATEPERIKIIMAFLAGLDYTTNSVGGVIISKSTGNVVKASTVTCYLNGYIPDKPYIKTNCPAY